MFIKQQYFTNIAPDYIYEALLSLNCPFVRSGKELYLVGGCVRDMMLGRTPKDYDLCTNLTPDEVKALLAKQTYYDRDLAQDVRLYDFIDTGVKHGTITVYDREHAVSFEVTTYRQDGDYHDGRHPDSVTFVRSLEEDLKRRDFTVNSLAYDLHNHMLYALDESFLRDFEYGVIRTVGNPEDRFEEDALRMLRAIRFAAQLGFTISRDTYAAIKKCAQKLSLISKERIRDEVTKILLSDRPDMLKLFVLAGLEKPAFGFEPLGDMMRCEHDNPWHYADVFHHTMDVVNAVPKTFELRWAALLHDAGKPAVKTLKEGTDDYYNYIGHPDVSAEIALRLMDTLKFSNEQKDIVYKFVKYHDAHLAEAKNSRFKSMVAEIGKDRFLDFIKLRSADSFAHRLLMDTKFAVDFIDIVKERFMKIVDEDQALTLRDLKVNGYDIMALGLSGKDIGVCLSHLLEAVLDESCENEHDALIEEAKAWAGGLHDE